MNIAENAEAFRSGKHPGYEPTALDGVRESLDVVAKKRTKVIINGGSLNPKGLAQECQTLVCGSSGQYMWILSLKLTSAGSGRLI
jgi:hypothetical protein